MTRVSRILLSAVGVATLAGCGAGGGTAAPNPAEVPLTVAEWQTLPPEKKYQVESYERLKVGEAKFKDERVWEQFYRSTVLPGRKKDMPNAK